MKLVVKLIVLAVLGLNSSVLWACSCADRGFDFWLKEARAIIVAVPMKAEVIQAEDGNGEHVEAALTLLDVLKGPKTQTLPVMRAAVDPQSTACQSSIMLGTAYVLFLRETEQDVVHASVCRPGGSFHWLRIHQEEVCFEGHPWGEQCNLKILELLRSAENANAKYSFDEEWQREIEMYSKRRSRTLRQ
ncbi:hypothetical protein [Haliea sp.]|jgi:hypothetical protein|uniref:hypothetical protein n=1 Tax=Haliea sp. TaxID=1932666 RepID=UPI0025BF2962|nr:hypothetical protein [Haliea sp.]|tara:strand:+ start:11802 stop:12368 length:567 start_codon:yes stop_codon:yes gene_type:complete